MPKRQGGETKAERIAREEFERLKELDDLKKMLADPRLRAFLWRFLSWTNLFAESFNPNFGITAHNLGRRAAGIWMLREINEADFGAWVLMQQEGKSAQLEAEISDAPPPEPEPEA